MYATADALVEPDWRDRGLLDTAVVDGAVRQRRDRRRRGLLRGRLRLRRARRGVRLRRHGHHGRRPRAPGWCSPARPVALVDTVRSDQELLADAYVAELAAFVDAVRAGTPGPGDGRGRPRRAGDRAGRGRVGAGRAPGADRARWPSERSGWRVSRRDGVPRPAVRRAGPADRRRSASRWRSGTGPRRTSTRWPRTGATFSSMTGYVTRHPRRPRRRRGAAAHRRASRSRSPSSSTARGSTCTAPASTTQGLPVRPDRGRDAGDVAARPPAP